MFSVETDELKKLGSQLSAMSSEKAKQQKVRRVLSPVVL